ncbi:MAG: ABC transporter substrate-binding protein [Thermoleophilia bacterium]
MRAPAVVIAALALLAAALAGCGGESAATDAPASVPAEAAGDWDGVLARARDQTVRWWMYGGDVRVNAYVDDVVAPAAAELGVTLERVPITDTADAVKRVAAELRAGREEGGSVDLIWINGENFAAGKQAGLWRPDWVAGLPNSRYLDLAAPAASLDLQVPTDGQEAPWSGAAFVYAYDRARLPDPPDTFAELLVWARANPGRFTYPAPPDFTGSAFVRQVVQRLGSLDAAVDYLRELRPYQWRGGDAFPKSEAELNELFGNGEVDLAMSYDPSFVATGVARGTFPETVRPFLLEGGALVNTSFVAIPRNAGSAEGALVVANLLLDPALQAVKADPAGLGIPTVLDLGRLDEAQRAAFSASTDSPYLLSDFGKRLAELAADRIEPIERAWLAEVLG